jgi:hypothetical protein
MAYAKLVFQPGVYALKKLKEIVRFATGQISTTADLEFAEQNMSEVVIVDAPGWTLEAQSFESSGIATADTYRLTAPCVNPAKVKNLLIETRDLRYILTQNATSTAAISSTATVGYIDFILGTSWSGTTLNNKTSSIKTFGPSGNSEYHVVWGTSLESDIIYVFSSARKLIVFSPENSGRYEMETVLEFPETVHASKHDNIPVLVSSFSSAYRDSPYKSNPLSNSIILPSISGYGQFDYRHYLLNWYTPQLNTRANRAIWDWGVNNVEYHTSPTLTVNSSGQISYPLIPLTDVRVVYGEGIHNYSVLTDLYITGRPLAYSGYGDTITISGQDYVIIQVGAAADLQSNSNNYLYYRAFAVKKG